MTLSSDQRKIAIKLLVEKSQRNMEQAIKNSELNYWDLVANRLYYSMFHAVTALMMADGIKNNTHKGTSSQFGRYYVLSGQFSREDGILYSRLQTMREKADYQNTFILDPEKGNSIISQAQALQGKIINAINSKLAKL